MPTLEDQARIRAAATAAARVAIRTHMPDLDNQAASAAAKGIVDGLYELRTRRGLAALRGLADSGKTADFRRTTVERASGGPTRPLSNIAFYHATYHASQVLLKGYRRTT
ncbi:hypothetical protein ABT336_11945 [Micromonospora sp. NPDC000207]|uniref:hypothetical protein n=1 Tax=Micromonospora sp. NPDC000207 TaxID=3154246 RepID=UPI00331E4937